jgi:cadmium resistance protein CadD (predicted permease)
MKTKSINLAIFIPLFFSHFLATENLPKQHFLLEILVLNFATKEIPYHGIGV